MVRKNTAQKIFSLVAVAALAASVQTALAHEAEPIEDQPAAMADDVMFDDRSGPSEVEFQLDDDRGFGETEMEIRGREAEIEAGLEVDQPEDEIRGHDAELAAGLEPEDEIRGHDAEVAAGLEPEDEIRGHDAEVAAGLEMEDGMEIEVEHGVVTLKPHGGVEAGEDQQDEDRADNSGPSANSGPGSQGSASVDRSGPNPGSDRAEDESEREESRGENESNSGGRR